MDRAYSILEIKSFEESHSPADGDERVIRGIATTPETDRVGDIVEPLGVQFKNPLVLLHQHDHSRPVGTVTFDKPTEKGITFEARLPRIEEAGPLKERIDTAWGEIKAGLVRAVSIGFRALDDGIEVMRNGGIRFLKTEVLELSLVSIPANSQAVISEIKSIDASLRAASGRETEAAPKGKPAASGVKTTTAMRGKKMARKSYAERIAAFEETLSAKRAEMEEMMDEAGDRTFDSEEQDAYDALDHEVKELREHIKRLKTLQADAVEKAKPVEDVRDTEKAAAVRQGIPAQAKAPKPDAGIRFARYARCLGLARKQGRDLVSVAEAEYGNRDPEMVNVIKAAVSAVNTATDAALIGNEGGFGDFVEYLRPMTIVGRLGREGLPGLRRVPFRVPLIRQTGASTGYWVGEGAAKPLTKPSWGRTELAPLKAANIAVATMEALRDSSPAAEALLRDDLAAAIASAVDTAFIDPTNAGSSGVKPASITNGLTPIPSSGNDAASIREDVRQAMTSFVAANNPLSAGVWVMSSTTALGLSMMRTALDQPEFSGITMTGGTFFGLPVLTSEHVDGYVVLMNASDVWFADDGGVAVDMSTEASLEMADNPSGSSVTPTPAELVSMFQTNSVAFRAERTLNWARRRDTGVALISGVDWGAPEEEPGGDG